MAVQKRNERCLCGSGEKYKNCCFGKDQNNLGFDPMLPNSFDPDELLDEPDPHAEKEPLKAKDLLNCSERGLEQLLGGETLGEVLGRLKENLKDKSFYLEKKGGELNLSFMTFRYYSHSEFQFFVDLRSGHLKGSGDLNLMLCFFYYLLHLEKFPFTPKNLTSSNPYSYTHHDTGEEILENMSKCQTVLKSLFGGPRDSIYIKAIFLKLRDPWLSKPKGVREVACSGRTSSIKDFTRHPYLGDELGSRFFLEDCLSYQFSDNTIFSLNDIHTDPYNSLLPPELDPRDKKKPKPHPLLKLMNIPAAYLSNSTGSSLGKALSQVGTYCEEKKTPFFLMMGKSDKKILTLPIQGFERVDPDTLVWSMEVDKNKEISIEGVYDKGKLDGLLPLSEGFYYSEKKKYLVVNDCFQEKVQAFEASSLNRSYPDRGRENYKINFKNLEGANTFYWLFSDQLKEKGKAIQIKEVTKLNSADFERQAHFSSENSTELTVRILYPKHKITLTHLPSAICKTIKGSSKGLGGFFEHEDNKDLAQYRRGDTRKNELKILRHRGFFMLILIESLQILTKEYSYIEDAKVDLRKLLKKTSLLAKRILKIDESSSKKVYSKNFEELIKSVYADLSKIKNIYFFTPKQTYEVPTKELYLPILTNLCEFLMSQFGSKSYLSNSSKSDAIEPPEYDDIIFGANYRSVPTIDLEGIFPKIIPTLDDNIGIYVDKKPLQSIDPEDFKTQLGLSLQTEDHAEDWFELNPNFFFKGKKITTPEALLFAEGSIVPFRGNYYQIDRRTVPSLKWLSYLWDKLQSSVQKKTGPVSADHFYLPRSRPLELLAFRAAGIEINGGKEWSEICSQFDALGGRQQDESCLSFPKIKAPLKDFQKVGLRWMLDLHALGLGGVLADDMGLGKTIQALCFLEDLALRGKGGLSLIVVPTSLVYNWVSEKNKFTPNLNLEVFESNQKDRHSKDWVKKNHRQVICSYGHLQRNADFFSDFKWDVVIFDEAQNIKNISSKRCASARRLEAKSKFCLTGTPMENHYGEFFSLIDLVVPGSLGSYNEFMKVYSFKTSGGGSRAIDTKEIEFLKLKVAPLVLRRSKERMLKELPGKTENIITIPFEKEQKRIYKNVAISGNESVRDSIHEKGANQSQLQMLTALLRLRQACSYPDSLPGVTYKRTPPKIEVLIEQTEALLEKGESVLVFTNFLSTLDYVVGIFKQKSHHVLSLSGGKSAKERQGILKEFDECEQASVLVMTLKTGGVGLNLVKANHVFHLEPWWNPAAENQGTDRVHRMGQDKHVHVIRLIMEESIEEKIQKLKWKKSQAFDALFSESEKDLEKLSASSFQRQKLSQQDFEFLLDIEGL